VAAAVVEAIARVERDPEANRKVRAPDPEGGPGAYFDLSVPAIVIKYRFVDNGAAFEVTAVRGFMVG
jgi:hypothetical protein